MATTPHHVGELVEAWVVDLVVAVVGYRNYFVTMYLDLDQMLVVAPMILRVFSFQL